MVRWNAALDDKKSRCVTRPAHSGVAECDDPGRGICTTADVASVLVAHTLQRSAIDAEELGRRGLVLVGVVEHLRDVTLLEHLERGPIAIDRRGTGSQLGRRRHAQHRGRQIAGQDHIAATHRDRASHRVLELAHVAWPPKIGRAHV